MHAPTDPITEVRAAAAAHLTELETALVAHGFTVEVEVKFWALTVTARPDRLSPSRSMRVQLATDDRGALGWYRQTPDSADVELLCPAAGIADAAERIAHVLRTGGRQ